MTTKWMTVEVDVAGDLEEALASISDAGCKGEVINPIGPGGGNPEVKVSGPASKVQAWLSASGYEEGDYEVVS